MPPHRRHWSTPRPGLFAIRGPESLSGRLLAVSTIFTILALVIALFVMHLVLSRFVRGQIDQRLDNKVVALASQIAAAPDGIIRVVGDANGPPFDRPHGRSFWWVEGPRNGVHTTWLRPGDYTPPSAENLAALPAPPRPPSPPPGEDAPTAIPEIERSQTIEGIGPRGTAMHVRVARRTIDGAPVTILVAAPETAMTGPIREGMTTVAFALVFIGAGLLLASLAQVRLGLRPLTKLRQEIEAVRDGEASALSDKQPREVKPLVAALNALIAQNADNLVRARGHVANLAHGLKTPLATLALTVDRLHGPDHASIRQLVEEIDSRIRHHLGRARVAALAGPVRVQTPLAERLRDVVDALEKINADKGILVGLRCPADLAVACEPQDVDEMVGNLLENAFRYARLHVTCSAAAVDRDAVITIADDGPGLGPEDIATAMTPGRRLDETDAGHGFGLSIARELAELYGGELTISAMNGLVAELRLPRVAR